MTIFKTYIKIVNKCKAPILLYTIFLIFFGGMNLQTENQQMSFQETKPDILIVNQDEEKGITKNLIEYLEQNSNNKEIEPTEEKRNDALFYRDVSYIIYIPKNFRKDFLNHQYPEIKVKSTDSYHASLAEMMLKRYYKIANIYNELETDENEIINKINEVLNQELEMEMTSQLDNSALEKASFYFNFTNYCTLAGCIYVICLLLTSFKKEAIKKRTIISKTKEKELNLKLLLSNGVFAFTLWLIYIGLSILLLGNIMFSIHGLLYIVNAFIFTFCALTIAFLLSNLVMNKNAINGIVNVIALGSSFLCGAFVPMEMLPNVVLKIAHLLPSFYFIKNNESIKTLETINLEGIKPLLLNMGIVLLFSIGFILLTNFISHKKRKID